MENTYTLLLIIYFINSRVFNDMNENPGSLSDLQFEPNQGKKLKEFRPFSSFAICRP